MLLHVLVELAHQAASQLGIGYATGVSEAEPLSKHVGQTSTGLVALLEAAAVLKPASRGCNASGTLPDRAPC